MPTLWPHVPSRTEESLEFRTDVLEAYTAEMRCSSHDAAQVFTNAYGYTGEQAARAEWLLRSDPLGEWYVPIWHDGTRVTSTISSGAGSLTVDTDAEYVANGYAAIIKDDQNAEVVQIASVGSGSLTLTGTVSATYTASTLSPVTVAPVRTCIMPGGVGRTRQYGFNRHTIEFLAIETTDIADNPFSQLSSLDVVTDPPRIRAPYGGQVSQRNMFIGNGWAGYAAIAAENYARDWSFIEYTDQTAAERWRRRRWLHEVRGRDKPFWLPTFVDDAELTASIGGADVTFTVTEFAPTPSQLVGKGVYITEGSNAVSRVITGASTAAGVHTITIAATGVAFTTAARVSLMHKTRFDTDRFEIQHLITPDGYVSRFSAPVVEVP